MLKELFKHGIRKALLVVEIDVLKDSPQAVIRVFDRAKRLVQVGADVRRVPPDVRPEVSFRNVEPMLIGIGGELGIPILGQPFLILLAPDVTQALIKKQSEDVMLVVGGVNGAAQNVCGAPEVALQLRERQNGHGRGCPRFELVPATLCKEAGRHNTPEIVRSGENGLHAR